MVLEMNTTDLSQAASFQWKENTSLDFDFGSTTTESEKFYDQSDKDYVIDNFDDFIRIADEIFLQENDKVARERRILNILERVDLSTSEINKVISFVRFSYIFYQSSMLTFNFHNSYKFRSFTVHFLGQRKALHKKSCTHQR
jgi:hypothetical protein